MGTRPVLDPFCTRSRAALRSQVKSGGADCSWSSSLEFRVPRQVSFVVPARSPSPPGCGRRWFSRCSHYARVLPCHSVQRGPTRIGMYGDMGHSRYNAMGNLAADCAEQRIDLIVHMGDHAYDFGMVASLRLCQPVPTQLCAALPCPAHLRCPAVRCRAARARCAGGRCARRCVPQRVRACAVDVRVAADHRCAVRRHHSNGQRAPFRCAQAEQQRSACGRCSCREPRGGGRGWLAPLPQPHLRRAVRPDVSYNAQHTTGRTTDRSLKPIREPKPRGRPQDWQHAL